jgi:hypothetical protein
LQEERITRSKEGEELLELSSKLGKKIKSTKDTAFVTIDSHLLNKQDVKTTHMLPHAYMTQVPKSQGGG